MSRILVDEIPNRACDCPFSFMKSYVPDGKGVNSHYIYGCVIKKAHDGWTHDCCLEYNSHCDFITGPFKDGE